MSYFTRKNIIAALVIILLVINVVTLVTFVFRPHFIFHRNDRECVQNRFPADFFKEELNLTKDQFSKFDRMRKKHMDTINSIAEQMKAKRKIMTTEMMKTSPDSTLLFKTADELGDLYTVIRKLNLLHYWQIKSLCNDQQKQKLDSIYNRMFCCNEGMTGRYGDHREKGECEHNTLKEGCKHRPGNNNDPY